MYIFRIILYNIISYLVNLYKHMCIYTYAYIHVYMHVPGCSSYIYIYIYIYIFVYVPLNEYTSASE